MKKVTLFLLILALFMIGTVITITTFVLFTPHITLNQQTLAALKRALPEKMIDFKEARLAVEGISIREKRLSFTAKMLSLHFAEFDLTASPADFSIYIILQLPRPTIVEIGPIKSDKVVLNAHLAKKTAEAPTNDDEFKKIGQLLQLKWNEVAIKSVKFAIRSGSDQNLGGQGSLHLTGLNQHPTEVLNYNFRKLRGMKIVNLSGDIQISDYQSLFDPLARIKGKAKADFYQGDTKWSTKLRLNKPKGDSLKIFASAFGETLRFDGRLSGKFGTQSLTGEMRANLYDSRDPSQLAQLSPCRLRLYWGNSLNDDAGVHIACQGLATAGLIALEEPIEPLFPDKLRFTVTSTTTLKTIRAHRFITTDTKLQLNPALSKDHPVALVGHVGLTGSISSKLADSKDLALSFALKLSTLRFDEITSRLAGTSFAIPAPINQLAGKVSCEIKKNRLIFPPERINIPLNCAVDLKSKDQTLSFMGSGDLALFTQEKNLHASLNLLVDIRSIDFVLPKMTISSPPPKLALDKRIIISEQKSGSGILSNFAYKIRVKTHTQGAIRLISNLLKKPLPLSVDAVVTDKGPITGQLVIKDSPVDFMRRHALVEIFKLNLSQNPDEMPMSGSIKIKNNQYVITIGLLGTLGQPRYYLQSDPPLAEKELLAVLLFGKEPDFLDADKLESVDNTRAALADGMISLISMYYLASSPVESIGYNPLTKVFSASINVAKGVSLVVGTNTQNMKEVGLRKRLGGGWSLETTVTQNEQTGSNQGGAMLRWRFSY